MRSGGTPSSDMTSTTCSSPFGQRARLVERDGADVRQPLERAPPLISTPLRAAAASAETTETGVEMTSAHGHEMTSSTSAR